MSDLNEELNKAAYRGKLDEVRTLIKQGADVNSKSIIHGESVLMTASLYGYNEIVKTLIDNGADINVKNNDGWNPLINAAYNGHNDVVNTLIDNGADINSTSKKGWNALIMASYQGHNDLVENLILNHKIKISDKDKEILKDNRLTFTLDLIDKIDFEKSLQREIKPTQEPIKKQTVSMKI